MDHPKLLPKPDKSKSRGRKGTYCQRLARHLERFDENPSLWMKDATPPSAPFQLLPPELRQNILYHALDDDDLRFPRLNSTTLNFHLVCKQFAADLSAVSKMWEHRAAELSELHGGGGIEKKAMNALIKDMMGPLEIATAVLNSQKRLLGSRGPSRRKPRGDDRKKGR